MMKRKKPVYLACQSVFGIILSFLLLMVDGMAEPIRVAEHNIRLSITSASDYTIRVTLRPTDDKGQAEPLAEDLILSLLGNRGYCTTKGTRADES